MAKYIDIDGLKPIKVFLSVYAEEPILVYKKEDIDRRIAENAESEVHGHWIVHTEWGGIVGNIWKECSVCHARMMGKPNSSKSYKNNFCTNCGAKMDEEVNE